MRALFIIIVFLSSACGFAQTSAELETAKEFTLHVPRTHKPQFSFAKQNRNEIELIFSSLFLFYKTFISSQDSQHCNFTPSCSEYGLLAVKKKGAVVGIIATFDRLSRCNGLSRSQYEFDPVSGLLIDAP